jgi:WD40 repeat protein/tRNA A37 threonylcarbamoyladenosine biosynthesis protein TsaE
MSQKLEVLQPVTSARWDMLADKDFCMENTRTDLLATLESWARSSSGPPVLWLSGLAGTGKSTIARTLCQRLGDGGSDVLGASFFVSRDVQERRSPAHIVRSIVYQLAKKDHTFAKEVHQALDADRDLQVVGSYALHNQISSLLVQPAQAIAADRSFVIVIDALDECVEDAKGRPGGDLLLLIARGLIPLSGRLKLFITSRAESAIQRMFAKLSSDSRQTVLLHDLDTNVVQGDIRTYLQRSFQDIAAERKDSLDLEGWPSTEDFERLVLLCGVLFVVAATVIRFVDHPKHSPRLRLAPVLMSGEGGPELSPYRRLDDLYTQVLGDAVKTEEEDSEELCRRIRVVVGAIVTVLRPLPVDGLAILLSTELHGDGIHADDVQLAVESLSSLLLFKKRGPVKVFHPSFPDFVQDPKRCRDARFFVASSEYHGRLAHSCLAILNRCLRYNICEIPHPGMKNADIVNLQERLDDAIRSSPFAKGLGKQLVQALPEIIYYASRSWAFHLARASRNPVDQLLLIELNNFCRNHTFHWLEFVSLEESRVSAGRSLPAAIEWCRVSVESWMLRNQPVLIQRQSHEISNQTALVGILLQDTLNVLQVYHEAVRTHALHVYNSAGATMANAALIEYLPRQRREGASIPRLLSPRQDVSGPWRISDEGESDWVLSVAFSPDSARMAFGMKHGPVYIKDASNLELMATLSGHESAVRSVAFSSDGKHIVSGSEDGTVRVWDASFFQQQVLLNTHDGKVCCVAFSPDSTHIIAGTSTGTVRIWDTETLVQLASRRLASTPLYAISYSPEGARIVVAATDNNPRVYDACTFDELGSLKGHEAPVLTVAYSYDGTRVASGSVDETVRVWDAATFDLLATIDGHTDWIHSVAFSPDGTRIVSGSEDSDVQVWELQDDNQPRQLTKIKAHACPVRSVAFSPDGNRFASAGNDCAVRCWDANHYNYAELAGHENWVHSLAFSPDGTRVVSAAADHTICVWDAMEFAEIVQLDSPPLDVESIGFLTDNNAVCVRYHPGKQITWTCQTSAEGEQLLVRA